MDLSDLRSAMAEPVVGGGQANAFGCQPASGDQGSPTTPIAFLDDGTCEGVVSATARCGAGFVESFELELRGFDGSVRGGRPIHLCPDHLRQGLAEGWELSAEGRHLIV